MVKFAALVLFVTLLQTAPASAQTRREVSGETGSVQGVVVDWQYARILGVTVVFERRGFRRLAPVDADGRYEADLPAGTYLVTAKSEGFLPFRIKSFRVEAGGLKTLNIMLRVKPQKYGKCRGICL